MSTLPQLSFDGQIERLLDWLEPHVPEIRTRTFRCFDRHDLRREEGRWQLEAAALGTLHDLRALYERLCAEGREWINLSGEGATPEGAYLISVEYSEASGRTVTAVNVSGPPLKSDGSGRQAVDIEIV